jgi:hypothetical protein
MEQVGSIPGSQAIALYTPLGPSEIRMFHITGVTSAPAALTTGVDEITDIVEGWLEVVSLDTVSRRPDDYIALSYCWGDYYRRLKLLLHEVSEKVDESSGSDRQEPGQPTHRIRCNAIDLGIQPNLHAALLNIARSGDMAKAYWINALCINQMDHKEKAAQVQMMGRIYSTVGCVVAWLGPIEGEDWAAPFFSALQGHRELKNGQQDRDIQIALEILRYNSYFDRAWTFQEATLARRMNVRLGEHSIDWTLLVSKWPEFMRAGFDDVNHTWWSLQAVEAARQASDTSLLSLLRAIWTRHASDPRDKVSGVLGLYNGRARLTPDYTSTMHQVLVRAARAIVEDDGTLDILHYAGIEHLSRYHPPRWGTFDFTGGRRLPP